MRRRLVCIVLGILGTGFYNGNEFRESVGDNMIKVFLYYTTLNHIITYSSIQH